MKNGENGASDAKRIFLIPMIISLNFHGISPSVDIFNTSRPIALFTETKRKLLLGITEIAEEASNGVENLSF
jgi:hypothetical protein